MKLTCKVRGFRGLERADIEINPIALVAGLNYAAKSSLAQAVAAAVCGTPIPFFKAAKPDRALLTKTEAKELVKGGMDSGSIEIFADGKLACSVKWPDLECAGNGTLQCSKYAAGLLNVMDLEDNERQKFFAALLQAMPTVVDTADKDGKPIRSDLCIALMEAIPQLGDEGGGAHLKKLLDSVNVSGWDAAYAHAKETGARLKGQWEANAGEAYGAKKADGWTPKMWRADLAGKSLEDIGTACTQAQEKWQQAAAQLAVDAAQVAELKAAANGEAAAATALQDAQAEYDACVRAIEGQKALIAKSQVPHSVPCPHCGGLLEVRSGGVDGPQVSEAAMGTKERAAAIAMLKGAQAELAEMETELAKCAKTRTYVNVKYEAVAGAAARLKAAQERQGTQEAVDLALDYLQSLQRDKAAIESLAQCTRLHTLVQANQKIVDILAPDGLRRQKLVKALAKFNQKFLAALCAEADYPAVTLDNDLEVLYGARHYFLLSDSEKYRVKAVLQLAIALYDKSPLAIFDGADILDAEGRNGLFKMLASTELLALVCMTMADRKKVPDLVEAGIGGSYWVEQGIAYPLGAYPEQAKVA